MFPSYHGEVLPLDPARAMEPVIDILVLEAVFQGNAKVYSPQAFILSCQCSSPDCPNWKDQACGKGLCDCQF